MELNDTLSEKEEKKLKDRIDLLIEEEKESEEQMLKKLLAYAFKTPNVFTGYRDLDLDKFCNMIIYFAETIQPFKTKLNKLLFYTDFLHYKNTGFSISGCNYRAIELGPVPDGYDMLFDYFQRNERFTIEYVRFDNRENIGERFISRPQRTFDEDLFEETELQCLKKTARHFKTADSEAIIQTSHKEQAWKKYRPENGLIAYDEAFELKLDLAGSA